MQRARRPTPTRVRLAGRALNATIARAPWLWPVLRAPMQRFFDGSARGWDERTGAGSVDHLAPLAAAVTRVPNHPERVLDIGTGTGEAALFLAREYPRAGVRGVDISEEMIRAARTKVGLDPEGRIAFKRADAAALPYADESFDLVAQLNMPPFFAEIARVLRPAGHAIVASSWGEATPFYTPAAVLERGFRRRGIEPIATDRAGAGSYWVGRLAAPG
ncbi:MAG: methyltransferase domain-containing protein [Solirubrobacterales bacterium]|nr:methyltransferase domain-containing protein [Solirubrobacterales bacterium]